MIKEAMEYIRNLRDVERFQINGHEWTNKQLVKVPENEPRFFSTKSLASLVSLIEKEASHERLNDLIVHVESPTEVFIVSALRNDFDRFELYRATAELPKILFGTFIDLEQMVILLKSAFVQSDDRDALIQVLGNVTEEAVKTSADDGITQSVTAKSGIRTLETIKLKPIVKLIPYRTFIEVDQPAGEFLLRLKEGPIAALFEADGGAWKLRARKNIRDYFETALSGLIEDGRVIVTE